MDSVLLKKLAAITTEEKNLLSGMPLVKELYTSASNFSIERARMLKKGQLITVRPHTRFCSFPRHTHNYVEMVYMCSGETEHFINNADKIVLKNGELLILNQHASHSIKQAEHQDIAINFIVLPQFFDVAYNMIGVDNVLGNFIVSLLQQKNSDSSYLHFKVSEVLPIQNLLENMAWNIIYQQPNHRRINQTTMALLFLQLLNYTEHLAVPSIQGHTHALVVAILKEIEENYPSVSILEIAEQKNVSPVYVSSITKKATGQTFKALLQQKRLDKAASLLITSKLAIEDIIAAVGYSNSSYFYRIFKEKYGVSPNSYRKSE